MTPIEKLELRRLINDYATSYFVSDEEYQEADFKKICSYIEVLTAKENNFLLWKKRRIR